MQATATKPEIDKHIAEPVLRIFDAAALLCDDSWFLQLAPPTTQYHNPATIERMTKHLAEAQSALAALKRYLRRTQKRSSNGVS
jgi:hypothetical protein